MNPLVPGQRVLQFHHGDADNPIQPGTEGSIRSCDPTTASVVIDWDNGIQQSVEYSAPFIPLTSTWVPAAGTGLSWEQALGAVRAAGVAAGTTAAEWWCQDTIGGRATGDVKPRVRKILQAIDDDDPELIDGLPLYDTGNASRFVEPPCDTDLIVMRAGPHADVLVTVPTDDWAQAVSTYRDGFHEALLDHIAQQCRMLISPTGDGRDLSHLHPDTISIGRAGVFAGDWTWQEDDGPGHYRIAYAGTLVDRWNGWAVFSCTRQVAEAIVADQERERDRYRTELAGKDMSGDDLGHAVDDAYCHLYFDGDVIVADQRRQYDDPQAIERIAADADGRYVVMGWNWTWEAVDPMDCGQVIGELPAAGSEQEYVPLRHTPGMRVPHDRWQLTDIAWHATGNRVMGLTATLTLDGMVVGALGNDSAETETHLIDQGVPPGWDAYVAGSRDLGQPVTAQRLLDALVTETAVGEAFTRIADADAVLIRLIDDTGRTLAIRPVIPAPRGWDALRALGESVAGADNDTGVATSWEFWTGRSWRTLPGSTTPA
ncbi:hypothetical protein ACIBSW_24905 [Actinoplanes sp. NPDC049668]|uniref:hypothetical protein n=1 Tax=unclassified Actinoplanes TaxID=2626549 RepID=UPI00339FED3E